MQVDDPVDRLLASIPPRLHDFRALVGSEAAAARLLDEALQALQTAAGELRAARRALPAPPPGRPGQGRDEETGTLRALVRSLPVAAAALDLDGTVLTWNPAAERLLGYTEAEAAGHPPPVAGLAPAPEGERHFAADARHRDGAPLRLDVTLAPLADDDGAPRGTVALLRPLDGADDDDRAEGDDGGAAAPARRGWSRDETRRLLDGPAEGSLTDRLRAGVAAGLHLGWLRPGDRLPSIRDAARAAGSDHRVVSAAYQQLASEGVLEVRSRRGATVAPAPAHSGTELGETATWVARVFEEAAAVQVKAPRLPELLRAWSATTRLRCACVESTDDDLAALCHELAGQWGLDTFPVRVAEGPPDTPARRALAMALRGADVVVTTAFHARAVAPAAAAVGAPLVVAGLHPDVAAAVEAHLRDGPLAAVVADPRFGERLRALPGGERLRVVRADDGEAVAVLDPAAPVLLTRAAQQRTGARLRLLVPPGRFVSPACAAEIARVVVARNVEAARQS